MALENVKLKVGELNKLLSDKKSCVERKDKCARKLYLMPIQLSDVKSSIKGCLNSEVAKYDEGLDGIILSFKNVQVHTEAEDDPGNFLIPVDYIADVYIFKPKVGIVLTGIVSQKSQDHIACLVHKIFNVTIPRPTKKSVEDWDGSALNIGDKVTFKIVFVDLSGELPYIKGALHLTS